MSTLRFSDLVKRHGRPEVKSLWMDPKQDRSFMQAVKRRQVVTLSQELSGKHKDFGKIGFHQKPHASYLVFPKSVEAPEGAKVIGIKYDLINEPVVEDALSSKALQAKAPKRSRPKNRRHQETILNFNLQIRRTATLEVTMPVAAKTKNEAARRAIQIAEEQPFDLSKASIKTEAVGER